MNHLMITANNTFGPIKQPDVVKIGSATAETLPGILIQRGIQLFMIGAGIYALFNLIFAGYDFISAGDDAKKVTGAWTKITNTLLGLAVALGSIILLAIFSKLTTGEYTTLLKPEIKGLGQ